MGKSFSFRLLQSLTVGTAACVLSACGDVNIEPGPNQVNISSLSTFCTLPPKEQGKYTKLLFVVDQSGSNVNQSTDPDKARRLGAMTNFFTKHSTNTFIEWGLITFQNAAALPLITGPYFQDATAFTNALTTFTAATDSGLTPYKAALFEVTTAIRDDLNGAGATQEANYEIIFMSDGVPTDYDDPINDQQIYTDINNLVKLAEGRIHFSTVYYNVSGNADAAAAMRLEVMAEKGYGKFLDASNGGDINIDDLLVGGVSNEPYQIKDLFVYNMNSALCDDGHIGADSDSDGMCDDDEVSYNTRYANLIDAVPEYRGKRFSPTNRNSFTTSYSDLFIFRRIHGELLPACNPIDGSSDEDKDLLNNCEERFLANQNPQGPTQSWTAEMMTKPKNASSTNFDSDGDGIIDSLEFMFFKEKAIAMDYNSSNKRVLGKTYYDLFKNHQSKVNPDLSHPYNITVRQIERNDKGENCYTFDQENLPMYQVQKLNFTQAGNLELVHGSDENVILVYYIMVQENDPEGKGILKYSYQKIKLDQSAKQIDLSTDRFDYINAK